MNEKIIRVAVLGPESSGKSTMCEMLSNYFKTTWVKEYAREYLTQLKRSYTVDDIILIYKKQFEIEQQVITKANRVMFVDTEFINAKVWCEHVFGECPNYINEMFLKHPYDLYLLTYSDLPWIEDPLRENPGKGEYFFNVYKSILEKRNLDFEIISGKEDERRNNAIKAVENYLKNHPVIQK